MNLNLKINDIVIVSDEEGKELELDYSNSVYCSASCYSYKNSLPAFFKIIDISSVKQNINQKAFIEIKTRCIYCDHLHLFDISSIYEIYKIKSIEI